MIQFKKYKHCNADVYLLHSRLHMAQDKFCHSLVSNVKVKMEQKDDIFTYSAGAQFNQSQLCT